MVYGVYVCSVCMRVWCSVVQCVVYCVWKCVVEVKLRLQVLAKRYKEVQSAIACIPIASVTRRPRRGLGVRIAKFVVIITHTCCNVIYV